MKYLSPAHALIFASVLAAACSSDVTDPPVTPEPPCPAATPVTITIPGFPEVSSPKDNPLTEEGIALGRLLFYDPILSGDSTQSCGSCHVQANAFSDPRRFSIGIDGIEGDRQAPTIVNPSYLLESFWDGRVNSLEQQATQPVPNPIEMHLEWSVAEERLRRHADYPDLFCAAFGDTAVSMDRVVKAIAQFERTFVSYNSKYDRMRRGEDTFTPAEQAGFDMFRTEVGDCFHCHDEVLFSTRDFRHIGLDSVLVDPGRGAVTGQSADDGKFKAPTLRNIMVSAPYMHDGRFNTIREVIDHYNLGFFDGPDVDPLIRARNTRAALRDGQIDTLIIFFETLTDSVFLNNPDLSDPFLP